MRIEAAPGHVTGLVSAIRPAILAAVSQLGLNKSGGAKVGTQILLESVEWVHPSNFS